MSRLPLPYAATLLAVALAVPAGAFAQTSPAATPVPHAATTSSSAVPAVQPMTASASSVAPLPKDIAARVEQHIKQMHDQLDITAAEQPQWDQFAQVMRDNATQMSQAFSMRASKLASMNASDDMQSYAQVAQVHATNMQKLASAFQALYTTFPDQQRQVADSVFRATGGRPPVHPKH
jgi:protein CpxP